jgi:hypothetical protein
MKQMEPTSLSPLSAWESFYVIIGSSAGALTGLQFVVMALAADSENIASESTTRAFATPTIVHFCAVLLISVLLSAPWRLLSSAGVALAVCGFAGIVYGIRVVRHARKQTEYVAVFEDWLWHTILPIVAYTTVAVAGALLHRQPVPSLFATGASAVLLLFIGIHNAWDAVTYIAIRRQAESEASKREKIR